MAKRKDFKRSMGDPSKNDASALLKKSRQRLKRITKLLAEHLGKPVWEEEKDGLEILILTILSQNTADPNALKAYRNLCQRYPNQNKKVERDPSKLPYLKDGSIDGVAIRLSHAAEAFYAPDWKSILAEDPETLKNVIRVAGLPNSKGPAIQNILAWLKQETGSFQLEKAFKGQENQEIITTLSSIRGIGVKTVTVTLLEAWGADLCPVDTHVNRIVQRLGIVQGSKDPKKTYSLLQPLIPQGKGFELHHNLLTFGRTICTAKSPQCQSCFLFKLCPWEEKVEK